MQYRWHPLHSSKLRVVKAANATGMENLHCELPDGIVIAIPRWMTDAVRCVSMDCGNPIVGLGALLELRTLLDGLKSP